MITAAINKTSDDEQMLMEHKKLLDQIKNFKLNDVHGLTFNEAKTIILSNDHHIYESVADAYKTGFIRGQAALNEKIDKHFKISK